MFPDSQIAKRFACGSTKCSYLIKYGLAPYFMGDLKKKLSSKLFVVSFDEALNKKLKQAQMDFVMVPYLAEEIQNILKTLMSLFVKRSVLEKADTIRKLARIDTSKNDNLMTYEEVSVGIAAKGLLTTLINAKKVSACQVMEFKQECILVLQTLVKKLLGRSPIHYELVHYLPALDLDTWLDLKMQQQVNGKMINSFSRE